MNVVVKKRHTTEFRSKEIVNAARELILKEGVDYLTTRALAKKVGITQPAIYRHFKSKKHILLRVVDDMGEILLADFKQVSAEGESYLDALHIILHRHLLGLTKSGVGSNVLLAPELRHLHDTDLNERIIKNTNQLLGYIKKHLSGGTALGEVREDVDLDAAASLLFMIVDGLINTWARHNNQHFVLEEEYEKQWRLFRKVVAKSSS
jgi:AcrR family transcriptional regulator